MKKVWIIVKREYLQAVRKKSFLIMTFLGPVFMAAMFIVPTLLVNYGKEDVQIAVLDKLGIFDDLDSPNDKDIHFTYVEGELESLKKDLINKKYSALLYIPDDNISIGGMVYSNKTLNTGVMSSILAAMKRNFSNAILISEFNINKDSLDTYIEKHTSRIALGYTFIDDNGEEETKDSHLREVQLVVGILVGLVIYLFIFLYCSMVLRSVLEEKTNRIVEVIVSSVKPLQLMAGKIIGVALIGLTQLLLWVIFTFAILGVFGLFWIQDNGAVNEVLQTAVDMDSQNMLAVQMSDNSILHAFLSINFVQLTGLFVFYFLAGYLLYAFMFAAIGAAVDNDTDSHQFVNILSMPLLLAMIVSTFIADNPDGQAAFWLSVIPFTSPITMLMRLPAGPDVVQTWEIWLSCSVLLLTCMLMAWAAAKIYRTGILMYGKKPSYKELWKWLKYKN